MEAGGGDQQPTDEPLAVDERIRQAVAKLETRCVEPLPDEFRAQRAKCEEAELEKVITENAGLLEAME